MCQQLHLSFVRKKVEGSEFPGTRKKEGALDTSEKEVEGSKHLIEMIPTPQCIWVTFIGEFN